MKKRGISAIIATVLIILITVAAITIVWTVVIPMVKQDLSETEIVQLSIDTSQGYTVWDGDDKLLSVQVKRGLDEAEVQEIQITFDLEGEESKSCTVLSPEKNRVSVYNFKLGDKPNSIKIAPIIDGVTKKSTSSIDSIPQGNLDDSIDYSYVDYDCWTCGEDLVDVRDDKIYSTVKIGGQCWMAENLNVGTMIDGGEQGTNCSDIKKYCYDKNDKNDKNDENCEIYGGLYQWNQAMCGSTEVGAKGICPEGWHIPTGGNTFDDDYKILVSYLGENPGAKLKQECLQNHLSWNNNIYNCDIDGSNFECSGFNALPAGYYTSGYYTSGSTTRLGEITKFWSSSSLNLGGTRYRVYHPNLVYNSDSASFYMSSVSRGHSVRCIKD